MTLHQGCQAIGIAHKIPLGYRSYKVKGTRIIHYDQINTNYPIAYFGTYKTADPESYD
jgi:hypothetical protein